MANVKIGHASIAETGGINGTPGDQTGGEVCVRSYYSKPWDYVIRPHSPDLALALAKTMKAVCANDNIGYGQSDRLGLHNTGESTGWKPENIKRKVNCDCSSLIAYCFNANGTYVNPSMTTWNELTALQDTGMVMTFVAQNLNLPDDLRTGDVLLAYNGQHTAMVVEGAKPLNVEDTPSVSDPKKVTATSYAQYFDKNIAGMYYADIRDVPGNYLAMRNGAGVDHSELIRLNPKTQVACFGYYSTGDDFNWYYVATTIGDTLYTGFCREDFLTKI